MSKFTVDYDPECDDDLADIWNAAADQAAVSWADNESRRVLESDPVGRGTPHAEGLYLLVVLPLAVYYGVDEVRRHVQVISFGTVA